MRWWRQRAALWVAGVFLVLTARLALADPWTPAYVRALPDEAFAAVSVRPDGTRVRALPHHDAEGRVDGPHLRSALSRLHQVKGLDPAQADAARRHLLEHLRELKGLRPAEDERPGPRAGPGPSAS